MLPWWAQETYIHTLLNGSVIALQIAAIVGHISKQCKLAQEQITKTAPMGVDISAGDLLKTLKLKTQMQHLLYCKYQPK